MTIIQQLYSLIQGRPLPDPTTVDPAVVAIRAHEADAAAYIRTGNPGFEAWTKLGGVNWAGQWTTPGAAYAKGDMVVDAGWTMIAKRATTDRPAPSLVGARSWITGLPDAPVWAPLTNPNPRVAVGIRHTVQDAGLMRGLRYWAHAGQSYRTFSQVTPAGEAEPGIIYGTETLAAVTGWIPASVVGRLIYPGDVVLVGVEISPTGTTGIQDQGFWNYSQANGSASIGEIRHNTTGGGANMSIANTDAGSVNHATFLATLTTGDTLRAGGRTWTIQTVSTFAGGINITVTPTSRIANGNYEFAFTSAVAGALIDYEQVAAGWGASTTTQGFFSATGLANAVYSNNKFGMDVSAQEISASDDYDVLSFPTLSI